MKMKFFKKIDDYFAAAAFAEEGEFETARQLAGEQPREEAGKEKEKPKVIAPWARRAANRG